MNEKKEDIGALLDYSFDLAYGYDENNFELKVNVNNHVCKAGYIVYIENTEYGGVITKMRVKTSTNELIYIGPTWHGILETKILEPSIAADYLICNGEANTVINSLISTMGLSDLFKASSENSGLTISNYSMNRYINGYEGIKKMLSTVSGKLKINFQVDSYSKEGFVILSATPIDDYSQDDEFDSSQIDFDVEKNYKATNHIICLGKGDLKDREVIHMYCDTEGNISTTQSQFGLNEVTDIYENANAESSIELKQGGIKILKECWNKDSLQIDFDGSKNYDIGDIVGARENTTGIVMAKAIIKKIVTIKNNIVTITHKVGE